MANNSINVHPLLQRSLNNIRASKLAGFGCETSKSKKPKRIESTWEEKTYFVNDQHESVTDSKIQAISLFSGAGGLDIGAQLAGVKVISSLDFDKDSVHTMMGNKYFSHTQHVHEKIQNIQGKEYEKVIRENNPEKLLLIGGPPCQPFSKAGYWVTHKNRLGGKDPRNMIGQYLRIIEEIKPDGFLLENVASLLHPKNSNVVTTLREKIDEIGYKFIIFKANALDFGVPQKRKRVFFLVSKKTMKGQPKKTRGTATECCSDPTLKPHESVIDWIAQYDCDAYHEPEETTLGKTYDLALREIPPGKNYLALTKRDSHPNPKFEANKRFWNFLLKLHPNLPSWTIAAQPGPWVGPFHWNNRRLRLPEIAAIQAFPSDYTFHGSRRSTQRQIGNAVPPLLGKAMIEYLINNI